MASTAPGDPTAHTDSTRPSDAAAPVHEAATAEIPQLASASSSPTLAVDNEARPSRLSVGRRRRRPRRTLLARLELPLLVLIAIAIAIVVKSFVIQPFYIPSQSMEQTLYGCPGCSGDRILVFKPVYRVRSPHPGDIVVFKAPTSWDEPGGVSTSSNPLVHGVQWFGQLIGLVPPSEKDLVKRVIAVGGQTVKCCDDAGNVQISDNGPAGPWRSLNEPYIYEPSPWSPSTTPGVNAPGDSRSFGPVTVPRGRLWVMGDHRSESADSKYHCGAGGVGEHCDPVGSTVAVSDVIGKTVVIAWPPSRWRTLGTPRTFAALAVPGLSGPRPSVADVAPAGVVGVGLLTWRRRRRGNRRRGVRGRLRGRNRRGPRRGRPRQN
jgi:signal peptidase I